jgi:hypothetical protein
MLEWFVWNSKNYFEGFGVGIGAGTGFGAGAGFGMFVFLFIDFIIVLSQLFLYARCNHCGDEKPWTSELFY